MRITLMSGAGNRFAMLDGFAGALPNDLPALARAACAEIDVGQGARPDGLLIATKPSKGGACAMVLHNADGSRPETCGNGLRCVAKLVADRGHVKGDAFVIESDAANCPTTVERASGKVVRARVHMGTPRIVARDVGIALEIDTRRDTGGRGDSTLAGGEPRHARSDRDASNPNDAHVVVRGTLVDVGNPHCVLFVDDERKAPVTTHGPLIEKHAMFPRGTNVEFLALRAGRAHLRVWERGVGETQACGSGACAAAVAAVERGLARFPMRLELGGGTLEVDGDGQGGVFLTGPVEELGVIEWTPGTAPRKV